MDKLLRYRITLYDIYNLSKLPYVKILQPTYDTAFHQSPIYKAWCGEIRKIIQAEEVTLDTLDALNTAIYSYVESLKIQYPQVFDKGLGWLEYLNIR